MFSPTLPRSLLGLVFASLIVTPAVDGRELDKWRKPFQVPLPVSDTVSPLDVGSQQTNALAVAGSVANAGFDQVPETLPDCLPNTVTAGEMNGLLAAKGAGFVLSLCPSTTYKLETTLILTAAGQEISTLGYPTDETRAMLVVAGSTDLESGMSTGIYAACAACSDTKLRNIQIDGQRGALDPINNGGLIEMGGQVSGQLVEHVRSFDPRGWTCMHIAEGALDCRNATIRFNDIGPCGHDAPYGSWADGISMACTQSTVEGNTVVDPTDGGIVVFGALGSKVTNNTISVRNSTSLGGINLVDFAPWNGWYNETVVENNEIFGGFAAEHGDDEHGPSSSGAIIKIGIGMGPRVWFGAGSAELQIATGGTVRNNRFSGAFGWAMAVANVENFTVSGNELVGNTSFIGERSVNCTGGVEQQGPITLHVPFVVQSNTTFSSSLQADFTSGNVIFNTCLSPPDKSTFNWPYGSSPASIDVPASPSVAWPSDSSTTTSSIVSSTASSAAQTSAAGSPGGSNGDSAAKARHSLASILGATLTGLAVLLAL